MGQNEEHMSSDTNSILTIFSLCYSVLAVRMDVTKKIRFSIMINIVGAIT